MDHDNESTLNWLELNNITIVFHKAAYSWICFITDELYAELNQNWTEMNLTHTMSF